MLTKEKDLQFIAMPTNSQFKNRVGEVYSELTVLGLFKRSKRMFHWACRCSCGNIVIVSGESLIRQRRTSCGRHDVVLWCSIEGCKEPHKAKKLCNKHYQRLKNKGNPLRWRNQTGDDYEARFWAKTKETSSGCWEWQGGYGVWGYGQCQYQKRQYRAHRLAWSFTNGEIPENLHVLHNCDNPKCVNPSHLRLGTHQENMQDKKVRNFKIKGELNHQSKLTNQDVIEIKKQLKTASLRQLANRYKVSNQTILAIKQGRTWTSVALAEVEDEQK